MFSKLLAGTLLVAATLTSVAGGTAGTADASSPPAPQAAQPTGAPQPTEARDCRDAPTDQVATGATFNNPADGDPTAIVRQVCSLVKQAPEGARIRVAHFVMSGDAGADFAAELIAAHERGVDVQAVLDGGSKNDNPAVDQLTEALGTDESAGSWVHRCSRASEGNTAACIGNKGQHNKFYLFSKTGDASDVVVQSSANFTDNNSTTFWNNAVTIAGNTDLYAGYDGYFDDLAAEKESDDYYHVVQTSMAGGKANVHFFPRAGDDASTDPVVEQLSDVGCGDGTTIKIGMAEWDTYRIAIADRLVELAGEGCSVQVVYANTDSEVVERLSGTPGIEARELFTAPELPGNIHSKYMTVRGSTKGDADWVLTGSHNYGENSLRRNDEALIYSTVESLYAPYADNFAAMWQATA